jgi:trk system potassium uptake protein TrkH
LTCLWLWHKGIMEPGGALRYATFNVISIMTGTGYATADFGQWGGFVLTIMFLLMFIGGCAGSTTCGIKIFRFQVLYATAKVQLNRLMHPNGVFVPYYNKRPVPEAVAASVMGFFFLFITSFALLAVVLGLIGLDLVTALSGAATAIANVGPGLGDIIGPAGTFAPLPDEAKWCLSAGMLLGRLELFTVLVLLVPGFWRD